MNEQPFNVEPFEVSQVLKPTREQLEVQYPQFVEGVKRAKTSDELEVVINDIRKTIPDYCSDDVVNLSKLVIND